MALRQSKYRHTTGKVEKRDLWYLDLNAYVTSGDAQTIASSAKHIALVWNNTGGGTLAVIPITATGKRSTAKVPLIQAHGGEVQDLQFSPFDDNLLATSSEDTQVKLWRIPEEGLTENMTSPAVLFAGHARRVDAIKFHPTANNLLASGSTDGTIKLWDAEKAERASFAACPTGVFALSWNYDGSLLASTNRDKTLKIWDPRTATAVQEVAAHEGVKATRVEFLGDLPLVLTTGTSKTRDRQVCLWDPRALGKALYTNNIDTSTGLLLPFYDHDSQLLFLAGKGDSTVKVFDVVAEKNTLSELTAVVSDTPQKGICAVPKRALDVMNTEVARLLKLTNNAVSPITFQVPRKSKAEFAEELFPPTASTEPALSADEWFAGENKQPLKMSLDPATRNDKKLSVSTGEQLDAAAATEPAPSPSSSASPSSLGLSGSGSGSRSTVNSGSSSLSSSKGPIQVVRSSKYRHIVGTTQMRSTFIENLKVDVNVDASIKANTSFFAVPWTGPGGKLAVIPLTATGKLPDKLATIETGSQLVDFDINPFKDDIVATATVDAHVKLWTVTPTLYKEKNNVTQPTADFLASNRKLVSLNFHPLVSDVMVTTAADQTVKFWDVNTAAEKLCLTGVLDDLAQSVAFNYDGSLLAICSKDRKIKVLDPRGNNVVGSVEAHQGTKGIRITWLGNKRDKLFSVGYGKTTEREFSIWDTRRLATPLTTVAIDSGSGLFQPIYDNDTNVMFLAAKGDTSIKYYEIVDEEPHAYFLTAFQGNSPLVGVVPFPKTACDVKKAEILKVLKLTPTSVEPVNFTVPRTRMEFFQDDLYPPTYSGKPVLTADQWFAGETRDPDLISLKPAGMTNLSEAPVVVKEVKKFDYNKKDEGVITKEKLASTVYNQMNKFKTDHSDSPWGDKGEPEGVDESEWDNY